MDIKGIDVSAYNPVSNYAAVAGDGIKIAIMRIAERGNVIDPTFEPNYKGFRGNGIRVGVYKYSYALNEAQAREEARRVLEILNGRKLDFPVFYDMEWSQQRSLAQTEITKIVKAFRQKIVEGGYLFGIYCNMDWYRNVLDVASLPYDYWLAAYPYNDRGVIVESLRPPVGIGWQYSSKGKVSGIAGNVDLDVFYRLYESGENEENADEEYVIYVVRKGDTLTAIAKKYGTTVEKLVRINQIADANLILTGQKLKIPKDKGIYKIWVGECTGDGVRVRRGPGVEYEPIDTYPYLNRGNLVDVTGERNAADGVLWYQVLIAKKYKGYIRSDYIKKV